MNKNKLSKVADKFEDFLQKNAQALKPLQPLKPNQPTLSYKDKLLGALSTDLKSAIEGVSVDMPSSKVNVKFHDGTMLKKDLLKSLTETVKRVLPGTWTVHEVGYLGL